jgi:hypothetical protein
MNSETFLLYLDEVYEDNKEYFDARVDRYNHPKHCFAILGETQIWLRYATLSKLDESIKSRVVNWYKNELGEDANYQEIR